MKKILLPLALLLSISLYAQDTLEQRLSALEENDTTNYAPAEEQAIEEPVVAGLKRDQGAPSEVKKESSTRTMDPDTVIIRLGKRQIVIIEDEKTTSVNIDGFDPDFKGKKPLYSKKKGFRGHWAGFEWGFNGFLTPDHSFSLTDDLRYLELRQARSWNININFLQYDLGLIKDQVGLVTGLGLEINDYHFRNKTSLMVDDGITTENTYYIDENRNITKTKLSMSHITLPLLLEFQIPNVKPSERVYISGGVIGGVRLTSHTKVVDETNRKDKIKVRDDFNLSPFRYGFTARVGYKSLRVFANYYPMGLFEKNKGPEVYPFSIGLVLIDFS